MAAGREKFLRVAEAKPADAGRGIVRIDPEVMKILELKEGDIVLIEGAKSTAAGVRRGYPEDANRGVIRMDGMQRRNAGVGIDDKVGLRKALARPAEKVSLAPTEAIRIMGGEQYMAQVLQGRAITRGDVISVSVMGRKFDFVVTSFSPGADAVLVEAETEIMSKFYGQSEENLRDIFKQAEENAPSIIFIDELDSIAPKRDEVMGEVERRVVAQLLALMDGLQARGKVVVIGATNRPNALDPALRRPGRFDREIEIGVPDRDGRLEILQIHTRGMPLSKDVDLKELAGLTHGYVGADLAALSKEAAMRSLRRILPDIDLQADVIPPEILNRLTVTRDDFLEAYREMEPSTLREVLIEKPNVKWEDIGGLDEAKQELRESIEWPLRMNKMFAHFDARPPRGIIIFGPPGTGKTLLAKAVATESEANFISVRGPEFMSKWVGESERMVRETFRKAKTAAPCIIFFDEVDAITPVRGGMEDSQVTERVISQILTEMDGLEELHNVTVIAATNRMDLVDPALLRPGRFDRHIYIAPPDLATRKAILRIHTRRKPLGKEVDLDDVARRTDKYTGAELAAVCNEAAMLAIRETATKFPDLDEAALKKVAIEKRHFEAALKKVQPQTEDPALYSRLPSRFRESPEVS